MQKNFSLRACLTICIWLTIICCVLGDCPIPKKKIKKGRYIYQSRDDVNMTIAPENYLLRFRCGSGHMMVGLKAIVCVSSKWTGGVPNCIKMRCSSPPKIPNTQYELETGFNSFPGIGALAKYSCKPGYQLENETVSTLKCSLDSEVKSLYWQGERPRCVERETCSDPGKSPDGTRVGDCCFIGDVLRYSCNDDFDLVGSDTIECLPSGNWSSERPLCRAEDACDLPDTISHGEVKPIEKKPGDYYRSYEELEVECKPGYRYDHVIEEFRFIMCTANGTWDREFKECVEHFCGLPDPLADGIILELQSTNMSSFPYDYEITYVCNEGFRLIGDSWRLCKTDGWSGVAPHCEVIKCPNPGAPVHGSREGDGFEVGNKVFFKCFSGYQLLGSYERYCLPNGQWSGELARCDTENNYCPDPGIPINGVKNSSNYDLGEIVGFHCFPTFTLWGSNARECLPNRTWSGKEAICKGEYDFDNIATVGETLKIQIDQKAREQREKLNTYYKALHGSWESGVTIPKSRILDLNYPGRLILYFVFDASGSVGQHNFEKSIEFAKALVKKIGISDKGARAGALTFSSKAEIKFHPVEYNTTQGVLDALDRVNYTGGGTSASSALKLVREEFIPLTQALFGRKGQKSVVFILTDGRANMGGDPQEEAENLKADVGVEIYCIGITGNVLQDSLHKIASDPKEEHVFILQNYATLPWLIQEITNGAIDYSECGLGLERLKHLNQGRVVGGGRAPEPWPWMAAIYFRPPNSRDPNDAELQCGGSIINRQFILTASHCLIQEEDGKKPTVRNANDIIVKLGLTNVGNQTNIQEFEVDKFYTHPKYRISIPMIYDYDIALLHLSNPIEFNPFVRPICLPPAEIPPQSPLYKAKEHTVATGWGHAGIVFKNQDLDVKSVEHLKEVIMPIQSRQRCMQAVLDNRVDPKAFTERMFCAGDGLEGNDTCRGDSGGPLMQSQLNSDGNTYWTQIGIVSWGIGCGLANTYGYYTHVQKLLSFIVDTMRDSKNE